MNRSARAHRSTKVPGVKLRPAPSDADAGGSGSAKRARREASRADADEDAAHFRALRDAQRSREEKQGPEGTETARDWAERPLRGATLCMTGLGSEDKIALQKAAVELGASCDGNLTDDATHLIARAPGSEKYRCALTLGVPVLRPDWVLELRRRWCAAEACDADALMEEHTLKTFEGLNIVLAGFQEAKQRYALRSQMGAAGAVTPQALDMIPGCHTHIVCEHDAPQHSNTLKAVVKFRQRAQRFQRRGEALPEEGDGPQLRAAVDLLCVRAEWVEDSLAIGACMDEKKYDIFEAAPSAAEREANLQAIRDARAAKAKAYAARAAAVPKHIVPSTLNALAVQGRRGEPSLLRSIAASTAEVDPEELRKREKGGGLLGISREAAFEGPSDKLKVSRTHVAATATPEPRHGRASPEKAEAGAPSRDVKPEAGPSRQPAGVFGGVTVRIDLADAEHEAVVRKAIKEHGGKAIAAGDAARAEYCVSAVSRPDGGVDEPHIGERVTHFWIERCTFDGRIVAPADHAFARPTSVRWPIAGVQQLRIATTSKVTVEDNQVERVLAQMGLTTAASFKRYKYSHLFCGNGGAQLNAANIKVQAAQQWGVPLIDVDTVRAAYETGVWEMGAPIASRTSSTSSNAAANGAANAAAPANATGSQTQAAIPPTSRLGNDITNSESLSQQRRAQATASANGGKGDESIAMSDVAEPEAVKNDGRMAPPAPRPLPPAAPPAAAPAAAPAAVAPLPVVTSPSGTAPSQRAAWDQSMDQATYVNEQGAAEVIGLLQTRPRRPSTSSALPMARVKSKGKAPPRVRSGRRAASGGPRSVSISPEKLQRAEGSEPQHDEWQQAAEGDGDAHASSPRGVPGSDELGSTAAVESICIVYQDPSTTKARAELEALFRAAPATDGSGSNGAAPPSSDSLRWEHRPRASPHTPERAARGAVARKSSKSGGRLATSAAPR